MYENVSGVYVSLSSGDDTEAWDVNSDSWKWLKWSPFQTTNGIQLLLGFRVTECDRGWTEEFRLNHILYKLANPWESVFDCKTGICCGVEPFPMPWNDSFILTLLERTQHRDRKKWQKEHFHMSYGVTPLCVGFVFFVFMSFAPTGPSPEHRHFYDGYRSDMSPFLPDNKHSSVPGTMALLKHVPSVSVSAIWVRYADVQQNQRVNESMWSAGISLLRQHRSHS